jgi:hypothetical protein
LPGPQFTPHVFIQSPDIAVIARDRKTTSSPLMNADDTNQESVIGKNHKMTVIPAAIRAVGKFVMD